MVCAVIPTYNNAATLADVVERTAQYIKDIIVVVDGSTDGTRDVLQTITVPITVVDLPSNTGKGNALKQGFKKAIEMGFTHALTIDSDGQHYPEDIPLLLRVMRQQPECYVVGQRNIASENMPSGNTFANRFSNFWFHVQTGVSLPDTQTGMRIYPLRRLHGLRFLTSRYEAELELLVFAAWANEKIVSVPIRVYYPPASERITHFRPVYDFARISLLNTVLCLLALVYGLPRRWWRTVLYGTWFLVVWLVLTLLMTLQQLFGLGDKTYRKMFCYLSKILIYTLPTRPMTVERQEGCVAVDRPAVYIANHSSFFDILSIVSQHPNLSIVTRSWIFSNPFFSATARNTGFASTSAGYDVMLDTLRKHVAGGASVLIFPEGTRTETGVLGHFYRGAFRMAQDLDIPLQPVVVRGTFRLMSKGELYIGNSPISLCLLPAVDANSATYRQLTSDMQRKYNDILSLSDDLQAK